MKNMTIKFKDNIEYGSLAVRVAEDVLAMNSELKALRCEVEKLREYRDKYNDLLDQTLDHNQHMAGSLLTLLIQKADKDLGER